MFKSLGKFFAKRALPIIIANLSFKVKTLEKQDGFYLWFYASVFGMTLIDYEHKISPQTSAGMESDEVLQLKSPVDISKRHDEWLNNALKEIG